MHKIKQLLFSFLTFVASFYFLFWILGGMLSIPFSSDPPNWIIVISGIASFVLASYLAYTVWKKTGINTNTKASQGTYIFTGALGLGVFAFIIGFFGPLIFMPESNQGPLLGILITGPGGIALGAIGGAILWEIKRRKEKKINQ
jgi:uncharacterized membrane protein